MGRVRFRGNAIPGSEVESLCALHWRGRGSIGLESASTSFGETYGGTVDDPAPVLPGSLVCGIVENDDHENFGDILLSSIEDVRASLRVEFWAIQMWCRNLSVAVHDKACNVFRLALQGLDALQ